MKPYYEDAKAGITIYNGDCLEILQQLGGVDLVLTDPPYGILINTNYALGARGVGKIKVNGKEFPKVHGNDEPFDPAPLFRFPHQILWGANHYAHRLPHNGRWLIWDKRCGVIPERTQADGEMAWCDQYGAARIFRHMWDGMVKDSEHGVPREHPTQKPLVLINWCLDFYPDAKTILDPFMGSGTTLRAAKDLGRKAIGIEIEEKYCEIAAKRLSQEVFDFSEKAP